MSTGVIKAATTTYSHAPLGNATAADWAWRASDLSILRTVPLGAVGGAITGGIYGRSQELEHDTTGLWRDKAELGAYVGAGVGALLGAPGVIRYANDALKVARAKSAGLNGNSIHSPTGFNAGILNATNI